VISPAADAHFESTEILARILIVCAVRQDIQLNGCISLVCIYIPTRRIEKGGSGGEGDLLIIIQDMNLSPFLVVDDGRHFRSFFKKNLERRKVSSAVGE
jgi:hypothetical protein